MKRLRSFVPRFAPVVALVVALALPGLVAPLFSDDVIHRAMLEHRLPGLQWSPFELYDFIGAPGREAATFRDRGFIPWFTPDDLRIRLFRPVSSALIALDAALFGDWAWAARLHSLVWFVGALAIVARIYRRVLPPDTAAFALLLYAAAGAHLMPISWIAARHGIVASTFAFAAFLAHIRAREDGWKIGALLSPVAFAAGLLSGEMALGAAALIVAWEVFRHEDGARERVKAVVPATAIAAAYLTFYVTSGYGASGSALYLSFDSGFAGVMVAGRRFLILLAEVIAGTPSDAFGMAPTMVQAGAALWGVTVAAAAWAVVRVAAPFVDPRERRAFGWMSVATALAVVPGTLAPIGGRVLTLALLPGAGLMAVVLRRSLEGRGTMPPGTWRRRMTTFVLVVLACGLLVVGPLMRGGVGWWLGDLARDQYAQAERLQPCDGLNIIVVASDPMIATYIPATAAIEGRVAGRLHVLSMAAADHRIENVTENGFDVVVLGESAARTPWEQLYRADVLRAGEHIAMHALDITVIEALEGVATRLRVRFRSSITDSSPCFFAWQQQQIRRIAAPVAGDVIEVPHEPGPMGW